jgi:hypothetical protein
MEAPHKEKGEPPATPPSPVSENGVPTAPRDHPAPAPRATRARLAARAGARRGRRDRVGREHLARAPHLRLEALDNLHAIGFRRG